MIETNGQMGSTFSHSPQVAKRVIAKPPIPPKPLGLRLYRQNIQPALTAVPESRNACPRRESLSSVPLWSCAKITRSKEKRATRRKESKKAIKKRLDSIARRMKRRKYASSKKEETKRRQKITHRCVLLANARFLFHVSKRRFLLHADRRLDHHSILLDRFPKDASATTVFTRLPFCPHPDFHNRLSLLGNPPSFHVHHSFRVSRRFRGQVSLPGRPRSLFGALSIFDIPVVQQATLFTQTSAILGRSPTVLTRNPQHPSARYSAAHSHDSDIRCPYSESPPSLPETPLSLFEIITVLTRNPTILI
ncbi:hypothetical protein PAXINDRAFT_7888 [Paxillus involutus ATCC 200175]|nr:hypothetical protein PAXINDRAFT_7888 [Paxillus involutus ATCC 200175]